MEKRNNYSGIGIMKKIILVKVAFCAILVLTVGGALVIELARANPVPWPSTPNQEKPTLTVETPQNYSTYNASSVYLNFTVTKPDSWDSHHWLFYYIGRIYSVNVSLDGNQIDYPNSSFTAFSAKLNQSTSGLHTLKVTVLSYTYYIGPAYKNSHIVVPYMTHDGGPVYEYPIVVSDIVYFTVADVSSPSPSPQETGSFPTTTVTAVSTVAVVAVGAGLVVYFKKRKRGLVAV